VTTLDDAKDGMNPDIRPQDDLFGHVNGRWLDTAEIPADRSSWGPFVMLADNAEQHVRDIIEACSGEATKDANAQKIGDLYTSFMDEARAEELGAAPIAPALSAVDEIADLRDLAQFIGELERAGGSGLFGSYVDTDSRDSDR
jgi:putative endopeptidase